MTTRPNIYYRLMIMTRLLLVLILTVIAIYGVIEAPVDNDIGELEAELVENAQKMEYVAELDKAAPAENAEDAQVTTVEDVTEADAEDASVATVEDETEADAEDAPAATVEDIPQENVEDAPHYTGADLTIIGDSIVLGTVDNIWACMPECVIDAQKSRQVKAIPDIITDMKERGCLGHMVVISCGTNGYFKPELGQEIIDSLEDREIFWVNAYGRNLVEGDITNYVIQSLANENEHVHLVDWVSVATGHENWFYDDGVHLKTPEGRDSFAHMIMESVCEYGYEPIEIQNQEEEE